MILFCFLRCSTIANAFREPPATAKGRGVRGSDKMMILKELDWPMCLTLQPGRREFARFAKVVLKLFKTEEL